ncbi:adenine deaminase [Thermodesulforhabdus norvegica]|uniref:Adenine deaminase n=1 Tax=Thermodesulforhabdus norvegica TaxID=39841 RepID=A0A1I4SU57_9BACT|nr:adenine deaminase [Thermodesulforhabdus norvegica]SFM67833.1 Adenine deaminase [Thermodesulforhabdus norvegica]
MRLKGLAYDALMEFLSVARGDSPAELCFRNARIAHPLTGLVHETDFAVHKGIIVGWGNYEAHENIDLKGAFVCAGFIEGHIHIESSLLTPDRFAEAVIPWGTTTVVADPHEIANVLGEKGLDYFLRCAESVKLVDYYMMLPSCVPASPLETSGAVLNGVDLWRYKNHTRVLGLGELMNFPGVIAGTRDVWDKILLFGDTLIDGHAPLVLGKDLNAYVFSGVTSDHECTGPEEAIEKLAAGMWIMIREGSQSRDLDKLIGMVNENTWPRCMFVSDDRHPDDLVTRGHLTVQINRAMEKGIDPIRALAMASLTPALYFGFGDRGALVPGSIADFSVSPSLNPWMPQRVFKRGVEVFGDGRLTKEESAEIDLPGSPMEIEKIGPEDFKIPAKGRYIRVIGLKEGSILTDSLVEEAQIEDGEAVSDPERDIIKIAVWNRYIRGSRPSLGFCKGLGLKMGALASTIAHDSHNLIVAGVSDEAMAYAADAVRRAGGGIAVASDSGEVLVLELPVGGLMTPSSVEHVAKKLADLRERAGALGTSMENPFMALSFIALPVIPELKITDKGIVDVKNFNFVPLWVD